MNIQTQSLSSISLFFLLASASAADEALKPLKVAPGVYVQAFSSKFGSANAGWVRSGDRVTLIGAPHPALVDRLLAEAERTTGKRPDAVVFTHMRSGERDAARALGEKGLEVIVDLEALGALKDGARGIEVVPLGHARSPESRAILVRDKGVLFVGDICFNGPGTLFEGSWTAPWIRSLAALRVLPVRTVIPGFGSIGGPEILDRQAHFLAEFRRQVGHGVAQGLPWADVRSLVRIEPGLLVWMPYDEPIDADIEHIYKELTVPLAPFGADPFLASEPKVRALAVIGDRPHEPGHLEACLRPAFHAAGIAVRFAVDPRALSAENLRSVQLLAILRDGATWPRGKERPTEIWMTPEQENAIVDFVERGGGFLALHNCTGFYREGGPYLKLLGGKFNGHGPPERFRVTVTDPSHAITRGVAAYEVADEQHTPIVEKSSVHILLESRSDEGVQAAAGWVREVGKGRLAYLANGHTPAALLNPEYQRLLVNAMRWCCRQGD